MSTGLAIRGVVAASVVGLLAACAPPPAPTAPFRMQPYGAGLELNSGGRRVILADDRGTVASYRVGSDSLRIYDSNTEQLGRIRIADQGYELVTADGDVYCTLTLDDPAILACGDQQVSLTMEGPFVLRVNGQPAGSLHAEDRWRFQYANVPDADIEETDDGVSVRTHDDARRWFNASPVRWHAAALVMSQVAVPGFEGDALTLVQGALAFTMAERFGATPSLAGDSEPPVQEGTGSEEGSGTEQAPN